MTTQILQNAFVRLAVLNPELAFTAVDEQIVELECDTDDDIASDAVLLRFAIESTDGSRIQPSTIETYKGAYNDPIYDVADYTDGSRMIVLPEDEDFALVRRIVDGKPAYAVLQYVNERGKGFVEFA